MNSNPIEARDPGEYDIDDETAASRNMLEKRVPVELNKIKLAIVDIDKARSWGKRPINPSFTFAGTAGYWVHETNRQFKQSHRAHRILA